MNETFEQVLKELRFDVVHDAGWFYDRLLSAHEREMDELHLKHERSYHALEVHCKQLEDAYLKATTALKPVLECKTEAAGPSWDWMLSYCHNAVREAQRIAKEGGVA